MAQILEKHLPDGLDEGLARMSVAGELSVEHALLGRILLAMGNTIQAIDTGAKPNLDVIRRGCGLIKQFVEQHHMTFEEESIYPRFEKGEIADFVGTLRLQHAEARKLVARIDARVMTGKQMGGPEMGELKRDFTSFRDMILAHAAYEESVLFPVMRGSLSDDELGELKGRDVGQIQKLFGKDATRKLYGAVMELESMAGIVRLSSLTRKAP